MLKWSNEGCYYIEGGGGDRDRVTVFTAVYHVQHWTRMSEYLLRYMHVLCKAVGNAVSGHKWAPDRDRASGIVKDAHVGKDTVVVI